MIHEDVIDQIIKKIYSLRESPITFTRQSGLWFYLTLMSTRSTFWDKTHDIELQFNLITYLSELMLRHDYDRRESPLYENTSFHDRMVFAFISKVMYDYYDHLCSLPLNQSYLLKGSINATVGTAKFQKTILCNARDLVSETSKLILAYSGIDNDRDGNNHDQSNRTHPHKWVYVALLQDLQNTLIKAQDRFEALWGDVS